jgi:ATP-binding cassette, subfamily B, bacterial MsbA
MNVIRRLFPYLRPYLPGLSISMIISLMISALSTASITIIWPIMRVVFPSRDAATPGVPQPIPDPGFLGGVKDWFIGAIESTIIAPDPIGSLRNLCLLIVGIFLAKNILKYAGSLLNTKIEEGMMKDIRDDILRRAVGQSIGFFNARRSGELMSIVTNDVGTMNGAITPTLSTVIREPVQIILFLLFLVSFSLPLTLIALSSSVLSLLAIRVLTKYIRRYSSRMQSLLGDITSRLQETFQNIRIIKGYAAERYEVERFQLETARYVRSAMKHSATTSLMGPISEIFAIAALAVVLFYGGYQVLGGSMKADELMTFLFILFAIMQPITAVFTIPGNIQRGLSAGDRVLTILEARPEITGGSRKAPDVRNELQLLNVGFEYREGEPVLRDVTVTVKRGQTVALVGPSGGGKSTLMDLVIRLYDPTRGGIYLDGVDIREFDLESYRSLFGIVTQESILFNDSVRNNIAYTRVELPEDRVIEAARMANAHDFISRLPHGYDTMIGDRGVLLSGGQRQRLAIARALARDPQILLFDEATSALDTESEMLVQEAINRLLVDRTAIVIAHRLSTIRNADLIVVLEDGGVVEYGTHDELLERGRLYRKLYDVQFREE